MVDFEPENPLDSKQGGRAENPQGRRLVRLIRRIGKLVKSFFGGDGRYWGERDLDDW